MNHVLRAGGAVAGTFLLAGLGALVAPGGADAQSCARPNMPASVVRAAEPDVPAMAQQQGIGGTVQVIVSLDANSRVTGTRIRSSPSAIVNAAALRAARESTYQTEIRNCVPIASDVVFVVQFDDGSPNASAPIAVISAQGVASRPPDIAYVNAGIITSDDVASVAAMKNDAIYAAVRARLKALGIEDAAIRNSYFGVAFVPPPTPSPPPRPNAVMTPPSDVRTAAPFLYRAPGVTQLYGYVANREVGATIADPSKAPSVAHAMLAAGATSISDVLFVLRDRRAAYDEALAAALKDAADQAKAVAAANRMHVAGIKQIEVGQNLLNRATPAPNLPPVYPNTTAASSLLTMRPATVEVRASVTVTYVMKP